MVTLVPAHASRVIVSLSQFFAILGHSEKTRVPGADRLVRAAEAGGHMHMKRQLVQWARLFDIAVTSSSDGAPAVAPTRSPGAGAGAHFKLPK